jgi:PAS domain S-box-containing protein
MSVLPAFRMSGYEDVQSRVMGASDAFLRKLLTSSADCIKLVDNGGIVCFINQPGCDLLELDHPDQLNGTSWLDAWPAEEQGKVSIALASARLGRTARFEGYAPTSQGTPRWWDVTITPLDLDEGDPVMVIMSRDITARVEEAQAMGRLLAEKDVLMQEIHHRVKNSLQLVQGLLAIQSRNAGNSEASLQLSESAARVRTIATMHDRLYKTTSALEIEIRPYMESLIHDMQSSMASTLAGRNLVFTSDDATWTAADVPTLGLVLTELVTNALKYGKGEIWVSFRQTKGEQALLTVEDEGGVLPEGFDPRNCKGLGMKLVTSLIKDRNGKLEFGIRDGRTWFSACMPRAAEAPPRPAG